MDRSTCVRRILATGDFAVVEQCSCGAVHVTIGAVTLRMAANTIAPLGETIAEAVRALAHEPAHGRHAVPEVLS